MRNAAFAVWACAAFLWVSATPLGAETFKVGALVPLSGAGAAYGPGMAAALRIAAAEIDAAGGVLGRKVELLIRDDATDPAEGARQAEDLIRQGVAAIVGTWSSGVTMAVLPLTTRAGVVEMNVSGAPAISDIGRATGLVFRNQASNLQFGRVFAEAALRAGYLRMATMAFNNPSGLGNTEMFVHAFRARGGTLTGGVVYEGGRSSYRNELAQLLAGRPQALMLGSYAPDALAILRDWKALRPSLKASHGQGSLGFIAGAWAVGDDLVAALGKTDAEEVWAVDTVPNLGTAAFAEFEKRYRGATGRSPEENPYAPKVYDQLILLALAAEAAGSCAPRDFKSRLRPVSGPPGAGASGYAEAAALIRKGQDVDYEGAGGPIDYDASGDVLPNFAVYRVEGGKLVRKYLYRPTP